MNGSQCTYIGKSQRQCLLPKSGIYGSRFCVFHDPAKRNDIDYNALIGKMVSEQEAMQSVEVISFEGFHIWGDSLRGIEFHKSVSFENTKFENIEIKDCRFLGDRVDFLFSTFSGNSKFTKVYFENRVTNFITSTFTDGHLLLSEILFNSDNTVFSGCTFDCAQVVFDVLTVKKGMTRFSDNTFSRGMVNFDVVQFDSQINNFQSNVFQAQNVRWQNVTFSGRKTYLNKNNFKAGTTRFFNCAFKSDLTIFDEIEIRSPLIFQGYPGSQGSKVFYGKVSMKNLVIENPKYLSFEFVDLSKVELRGTSLRGILFRHVEWDKVRRGVLWVFPGRSRKSVYDEKIVRELERNSHKSQSSLPHTAESVPLKNKIDEVGTLYRELKQNHDEDKNFMEAEDFYYGQWEMTRLNLPRWRRNLVSWEFLYWLVSGYGQRWEDSLFFIGLLLFALPLVFLFTGIEVISQYHTYPANYWDALQYNFLNITFQRDIYSFFRPSMLTKNLAIIESFLMPIITAFFVLALRRKFKR